MRLLLIGLLIFGSVSATRRFSNSDSSSDEDNDVSESRLVLSKHTYDRDTYLKTKPSRLAESLHGKNLVDYVNGRQDLWKASEDTKFAKYTDSEKRHLMGVNHVQNSIVARRNLASSRHSNVQLPDSFDSREQWGSICPSVKQIRDQSSCGSCWAFGAVEAMSDRVCIASKGKQQPTLSARDLLSCCTGCGFGCNGGDPYQAWSFWHTEGIVTGSNYSANAGCQPYPFPNCEHHSPEKHFKPCPHDLYPTPKCEKTCKDGYERQYNSDKYFGQEPYAVDDDEEAIRKELYTNGPLEVSFTVYDDLLTYSGGIYVHQGGKLDGGHAVKLVGWGKENNVPYWIIANSWNEDWGENGYFRILRGVDECGIESGVVGGLPDLRRSPSHHEPHEAKNHKHHSSHQYDIFK
jgi:cathepsin B